MLVELRPHVGVNCNTQEKSVVKNQDRLFVDGVGVGFVGHHPGAKITLTERFSAEKIAEIELQVQKLKRCMEPMKAVQPPEVPEDLLRKKNDELTADDLD